MEKQKQGSPSSSFAADLFGSPKPLNSSQSLFGSIFDTPSSRVKGMSTSSPNYGIKHESQEWKKGEATNNNEQKEKVEPSCYYNSSILYGGREVYPTTNPNATPPKHIYKKDGEENEGNSSGCASRGNWWKGSLYY